MPAPPLRADDGQASVELVALLPLIALVAGLLWQAVLAGQAIWLSGTAARAAARAHALGSNPADAARATLPHALARNVHVTIRDNRVTVRVAVPTVVGDARLATVSASSAMRGQR